MTDTPRGLIVFHTVEGQTAKITERIASVLRDGRVEVDIADAGTAPMPGGYDLVVVGDSIHAVHHSTALKRYLKRHATVLNESSSALFQVSLTSVNPDAEHTAAARAIVDELLVKTGYTPRLVAMFAGALPYSKYGWLKRRIMRRIVRHEGGDTDMTHDYEYTDWGAVDQFARDVLAMQQSRTEP
jgi:menaquinone-dependent protoporphyrinogen oxidase